MIGMLWPTDLKMQRGHRQNEQFKTLRIVSLSRFAMFKNSNGG